MLHQLFPHFFITSNLPFSNLATGLEKLDGFLNKILFKKPSNFSEPFARLQKGRLLVIKKCENDWCNVTTDNYNGWITVKNIWGSTK